jgi:hypothetical protein
MKSYGFLLAHGYKIMKGYVDAENQEEAKRKAINEEWDDIIDEDDTDELTVGYEVTDIWEID